MALGLNAYIARGTGSGTTVTTDTVTTAASGSFLLAICNVTSGVSITSVTDNKGNTFTALGSLITNGGYDFRAYYCENAVGGAGHTASVNRASGTYGTILLLEITGAKTASAINTSITSSPQTAHNGTYYPRPLATTAANTILIYAARNFINSAGQSLTCGGGYAEDLQYSDGEPVDISVGHRIVTSTGTYDPQVDDAFDDISLGMGIIHLAIEAAASASATLSTPTPSGTLGTTTTATVGATTNQTTGTLYAVVDSAANLSGVTAAQIKAGQKASGAAAAASGSAAVSTTTPSISITGLSDGTLYSYAVVQNNANGDSNVVTGTFTTAAATHTVAPIVVDAAGANVVSTSLNWWLIQSNAIVGFGTNSTNGSGVLSLTVAGASAGSARIVWQSASNATLTGTRAVTVT